MKINCLIADDEQLAREMLSAYSEKIDYLNIAGKCKNTKEIEAHLKNNKIDLILMDIQMPGETGIDFLQHLNNPPKIIFTTAFRKYAIEGYDLGVVDYLLKPIGWDRFEKAISKAKTLFETTKKAAIFDEESSFNQQSIIIKEGYELRKIYLKDIYFIEAMREYAAYYTTTGKHLELKSLTKVQETLSDNYFIRIHRSFIINRSKVKVQCEKTITLLNDVKIPIGKTYRKQVPRNLFK
ncbi:MAG: response regulator transcription factor [Bacteroidota bacterium]